LTGRRAESVLTHGRSARDLPAQTARWSTITQIYEGTNQVQRMVMARQLQRRAHVRAMLAMCRMSGLSDALELVVSKLVANGVNASSDGDGALRYVEGRMPLIRLCLLTDGVRLVAGPNGVGFRPGPGRASASGLRSRSQPRLAAVTDTQPTKAGRRHG
jgi:hypothetical protein